MKDYRTSFPQVDWSLQRNNLTEMLKSPKKSAPGPDGIPFAVYSVVSDISEHVLWTCAQDLLHGGSPPDDFSVATIS